MSRNRSDTSRRQRMLLQPKHTHPSASGPAPNMRPLAVRILIVTLFLSFHSSFSQSITGPDSNAIYRQSQYSEDDSLQLQHIGLRLNEAQLRVSETDFWHRLCPELRISASFGIKDLLFIEPTGSGSFVLPRDSYRLTVNLSVNDILSSGKHARAELDVQSLQLQFNLLSRQLTQKRISREQQLAELQDHISSLRQELAMKEDVLTFDEMRFQQGKIGYDALIHSRLDVLHVKTSINSLERQMVSVHNQIQ